MLLSIVINNYNYGRYLDASIGSALAQSYPHCEVIVVDDGSTDNSREIIEGYGNRIRAVLKDNGGQGSACNAGFNLCRGGMVLFLDADDYLRPNAADRIVGSYREGVAMVYFRLQEVDNARKCLGLKPGMDADLEHGSLWRRIAETGVVMFPPTSANAYARATLSMILPMPEDSFQISADAYLHHLAPFYGEVVALKDVLGFYRIHGRNAYYGKFGVEQMRKWLRKETICFDLVKREAARRNVATKADLTHLNFSYARWRFLSLVLDPVRHPFPGDSRVRLFTSSVARLRREPMNLAQKSAHLSYLTTMLLLPSIIGRKLAEIRDRFRHI